MKNLAINTSDQRLVQRYIDLFGLLDWKNFPRQKIAAMAFEGAEFWRARAENLGCQTVEELLAQTPIAGAHTLEKPAFLRT